MTTQESRDALAAEIRSWRRRAQRIVGIRTSETRDAYHECDALGMLGESWAACEIAARGLRAFATAFPADPADRAARIALARAVAEAAFRGELAPDFAAARRIARVMRARRA